MSLPGLASLPLRPSASTGYCVNSELPFTGIYAYLNTTVGLVANDPKPGFPVEYRDPTTTLLVRKDYWLKGRLTFIELYNAAGYVAFTRDLRQPGLCEDTVYSGDAKGSVVSVSGYSKR